MSSKIASKSTTQIDPNDSDTFLPIRASSHGMSSFSSLSSLSSDDGSPLFSPKTPLPSTRIPFSWEKLPGIPKKQRSKKIDASSNLLPLPPAGSQFPYKNINSHGILIKSYDGESFKKDPFFAAFLECSKDHDRAKQHDPLLGKLTKITRTLSEGFALVSISSSCKSTCVSDSIVLGRLNRS